ncbi:hypothetical protein [Flavobacterium restrictum]|uniref:Uncharacterized protein n=1 Tax=Flavobacterium restrictum TaxID=2594428 RepID=A0A553E8P0_9FLAO|nr:hypothetical protein [Flavobacterium restrictum]TRX41360.1 hypothetical protein FNW21_04485 [Flavobacterium restrictum]
MTISELKTALTAKISATNNIDLLVKLNEVLNSKNEPELENHLTIVNEPVAIYEKTSTEAVYIFNEWQQKRIDIALKQVENGDYISDEEAQIEIEKWFEEQEEK